MQRLMLYFLTFQAKLSRTDTLVLSSEKSPRIIGGKDAQSEDWPWMAALIYSSSYSNESGQFCGASLIHPLWVVSAGHCGYEYRNDPQKIEVIIGVNDLVNDKVERIKIKQIIIHKDYDNSSLHNDIALFELEKPVFSKIIPIISDNIKLEGKNSTVIG